MFYYLLCSNVCSLGHCVASCTSTPPGSICYVAVRHSHILIVARGFGTWASACRVLHSIPLHAYDEFVTFPCLWRRGSFPHSLLFYVTDTASTLTASWSRWSLVTSVPVAYCVPNMTRLANTHNTARRRLGGRSVKWGRRSQSLVSAPGLSVVFKLDAVLSLSIFVPPHRTQWDGD